MANTTGFMLWWAVIVLVFGSTVLHLDWVSQACIFVGYLPTLLITLVYLLGGTGSFNQKEKAVFETIGFLIVGAALVANTGMRATTAAREWSLLSRLEKMHRSERIIYHSVKNIICEAYATLELFLAGLASMKDVKKAYRSLKSAARRIHDSLQLRKIIQGTYTAKPSQALPISSWLGKQVPAGVAIRGGDGCFILSSELVLTLFVELCVDNAARHGSGNIEVKESLVWVRM